MSVALTPYGHLLYGAGTYGGIVLTGFAGFDPPANRAASPAGTPEAAMYDDPRPVKQ